MLHLPRTSALTQKSLHTSWKGAWLALRGGRWWKTWSFLELLFFLRTWKHTGSDPDWLIQAPLKGTEAVCILICTIVDTVSRVCTSINNSARKWWWNPSSILPQHLSASSQWGATAWRLKWLGSLVRASQTVAGSLFSTERTEHLLSH